MKMISLLYLVIKISFIINHNYLRRNQEPEIYDLFDISNSKCNESNYNTFFTAKVCGKTSIQKTQKFDFSFPDIENKNHSVECTIIIDSKRRLELEEDKTDDSDDNYDLDIENYSDKEKDGLLDTNINLTTKKLSDNKESIIITDNSHSTKEIIEIDSITNKEIALTIFSRKEEINSIDEEETEEIDSTVFKNETKETSTTILSNEPVSTENISTIILTDEPDTTIFNEPVLSNVPDSTLLTNEFDSTYMSSETEKSEESTIPTTIIETQNIIERTENVHYPDVTNYDFCYETLCSFKGMIRVAFEVKVENEFPIYIDEMPEDDIFIRPLIIDTLTYSINKCYLIKNIFKQVLKFKRLDSDKKITFIFISILAGKVEKNEEIYVEIYLKNNKRILRNLELEKNEAKCTSNYDAEPVEGKEILGSYNCEVNNIENPSDYNGLIFSNSMDVKDISNDTNYNDPALTDELIKQGKIQDFSLPIFNSNQLDFSECNKNSNFKILGKLNREIDSSLNFLIDLILDENNNIKADCSIPGKISGEVNITCKIEDIFNNSKILIPTNIAVNKNDESILNITEIRYENAVTCGTLSEETEIQTETQTEIIIPIDTIDTTDISITEKYINSSIVFRQICHLNINLNSNIINFNVLGFSFENLEKSTKISIPINLIKLNSENEEKNATCTIMNDTNSTSYNLIPFISSCELISVNNISQVTDIEIISSPLLINVPTMNLNLVSAIKTDNLIEQGELLDYTKEGNLNKIPPIILNDKINTGDCNVDGSFEIQSYINSIIERNITFLLRLEYSNIEVRCKVPITEEANILIKIKCTMMGSLSNSIIQIKSQIIYDLELNELFYINDISSFISICLNNDKIQKEEALKKANAFLSFRQACKFSEQSNGYYFYLATFIKKVIEANSKIYLKVKIKSELNTKKADNFIKRKLDNSEVQNAECSLVTMTELDENELGAAGWNCYTGQSSIKNATGLDIISSDDISGIPESPELIDPAKTDYLIQNGDIKDYTLEENLNELLPIFNILATNFSLCKQNGSFSFIGNMSSSINKDILFNISLSYPSSSIACRLPRTLKGKIVEIECFNRDDFQNSTVIVEETVIRDGFNEYFILRNISSGDMLVTCSSSGNDVKEMKYSDDFRVISRTIKDKSSGGIGTAGIIVLISVSVVVLAAIVILIAFLSSKNKKKIKDDNDKKTISSTTSSFGNSSSSYY